MSFVFSVMSFTKGPVSSLPWESQGDVVTGCRLGIYCFMTWDTERKMLFDYLEHLKGWADYMCL